MTPTPTLREHLRALIQERIPVGGSESDTSFTDAQLDTWFLVPSSSLEEAAWRGWLVKAGDDRGGVIERTIGSERLRFANPDPTFALSMADYYYGLLPEDPLEGSQALELEPGDVLGTARYVNADPDISRLLPPYHN